ncbi:hypothetical protein ACQCQ6_16630, partial [Ralstonia pseudosolanacearum]|uniref:hypothetical protein n=1 Tax=Ralstonia pseudosolanacearum TaxID=1310165 RepID=UPI003CE8EFCD
MQDSAPRLRAERALVESPKGNADLSGSAVIADVAEDVAEGSSRSGPTTMKKQTSFSEAEYAGKKRVTKRER